MQILYSLRLPPDVGSVPLVRGILRSGMEQLGVEQKCTADVALAVTEACANVITHASGDGHEYEVQVDVSPEECHIRVLDTGAGFDPERVFAAGEFSENGRGVLLMRALVDQLDFVPRGEGETSGTIVHLTKRLHLEPDSPLWALTAVAE
jgi:serine/threonine-protein kinase RsbW